MVECACGAKFVKVIAGKTYTRCGSCECKRRKICEDCGEPVKFCKALRAGK